MGCENQIILYSMAFGMVLFYGKESYSVCICSPCMYVYANEYVYMRQNNENY